MTADKQTLRQALSRAAILSNTKYRGVSLQLEADTVKITANNPEEEKAEDEAPVDYQGRAPENQFQCRLPAGRIVGHDRRHCKNDVFRCIEQRPHRATR